MRKLLASFALFMLFSMGSGSAFAEKFEVCEDIKKDPAYKGLYGLCNAYFNAESDEARIAIGKASQKKADQLGVTVPWLVPMDCPCWTDLTVDEICAMGQDQVTYFDPSYFAEFAAFLYLDNFDSGTSNTLTTFVLDVEEGDYYCAHNRSGVSIPLEDHIISESQAYDCLAELDVIAMPDFCDL